MKQSLYLLTLAGFAHGAPIEVLNPSGEINNGVDRGPISGAVVIGWTSNGGQVIKDGTDYGNGGWRLSFKDNQEIRQMTGHAIESGVSYSLRFDAAMFATGTPAGDTTSAKSRFRPGITKFDFPHRLQMVPPGLGHCNLGMHRMACVE